MLFSPAFEELRLVPGHICRAMGYQHDKPDEYTTEVIHALLERSVSCIHPRIFVKIAEGTADIYTLQIEHHIFHPGSTILQQFESCCRYYIFVETAGPEYENWKNEPEITKDPLRQYILDAIGTCIIEGCTRYLLRQISRQLPQGWGQTLAFSPGHCEWDTGEQQQLFSLFSSITLPVTLTDSSLMLPVKSASGIIGTGEHIKKNPVPCQLCHKTDCFRRIT